MIGPLETVAVLEARLCAAYDVDLLVQGRQMHPLDGSRLVSSVEGELWLKVRGPGGARGSDEQLLMRITPPSPFAADGETGDETDGGSQLSLSAAEGGPLRTSSRSGSVDDEVRR